MPEVYEDQREPYWPSMEEAIDLNKEAHALHGQPKWGELNRPNDLEAALNSPKQHYYYGPEEDEAERLAVAAGKLAHHTHTVQAFGDGNKRTAFGITRKFLNMNGLGNLSPYGFDDEELADHLIGHDRGTHTEQDAMDLMRSRYQRGGPDPNYQGIEWPPLPGDEPGGKFTDYGQE